MYIYYMYVYIYMYSYFTYGNMGGPVDPGRLTKEGKITYENIPVPGYQYLSFNPHIWFIYICPDQYYLYLHVIIIVNTSNPHIWFILAQMWGFTLSRDVRVKLHWIKCEGKMRSNPHIWPKRPPAVISSILPSHLDFISNCPHTWTSVPSILTFEYRQL